LPAPPQAAAGPECARPRCTLYAFPIPKGLRPPAQGCEERATLGKGRTEAPTLKGLWQAHDGSCVGKHGVTTLSGFDRTRPSTQGSSQARNPGLKDTIPLGLKMRVSCSVPGRSNIHKQTSLQTLQRPSLAGACCARGRAHSGGGVQMRLPTETDRPALRDGPANKLVANPEMLS